MGMISSWSDLIDRLFAHLKIAFCFAYNKSLNCIMFPYHVYVWCISELAGDIYQLIWHL